MTHKSLLPGVLLSGAWATTAAIWTGGLLWGLEVYKGKLVAKKAFANIIANFTPGSGIKAGLIVSLLLVVVCLYAYAQYRRIANLRHFLLVAVLTELLAVLAGVTVLFQYGYAELSRIGEATV